MGLDQYLTLKNKKCEETIQKNNDWYNLDEEYREMHPEEYVEWPRSTSLKDFGSKIDAETLKNSVVYIELDYWRKSNQIHNWFVQNVQNGEDDCGDYRVSLEKLKALYNICQNIADKCIEIPATDTDFLGQIVASFDYSFTCNKEELIAHCEEVLPTCSGFFFGSTDYDKWYFFDVIQTAKNLQNIINFIESNELDDESEDYSITYHSSW